VTSLTKSQQFLLDLDLNPPIFKASACHPTSSKGHRKATKVTRQGFWISCDWNRDKNNVLQAKTFNYRADLIILHGSSKSRQHPVTDKVISRTQDIHERYFSRNVQIVIIIVCLLFSIPCSLWAQLLTFYRQIQVKGATYRRVKFWVVLSIYTRKHCCSPLSLIKHNQGCFLVKVSLLSKSQVTLRVVVENSILCTTTWSNLYLCFSCILWYSWLI